MARKVIIDCDPGIDDAVALSMALFDSRLDVVAVTATAGNVDAHQASRNVQSIIELLDPPRRPRLGMATIDVSSNDASHIHGADGLGNIGLEVSELHRQHPSDKLILEEVHNAPGEVSIVALGPLTNIAAALNRDANLASLVDRIIMTGGSVNGVGNVTAAAEFNMYCDPVSARAVFRSPMNKTLIPLDITNQIVKGFEFMDQLPGEQTRVGAFLRNILPQLFRAYHQVYGQEGIHIHDAVTVVAAVESMYFSMEDLFGDVEVRGELTSGATIFDRRIRSECRPNMEVAMEADVQAVHDAIDQCIRFAGQATK